MVIMIRERNLLIKIVFLIKWTIRILISLLMHPFKIKTILKNAYKAFCGQDEVINFIRVKGLHSQYQSALEIYKSKGISGKREDRILIVTNQYPSDDDLYRNMFVHTRIKCYQDKGLHVDVFNCSNKIVSPYTFDGVNVYGGGLEELTSIIKVGMYGTICVHFIELNMYTAIQKGRTNEKLIVWIHGIEAERWHRRACNFSQSEIKKNRNVWEQRDNEKMEFMRDIYKNKDIFFVFISNWIKNIAAQDAGIAARNSTVIHNVINEKIYSYVKKTPGRRKFILSIRPYTTLNYANDLSVKAILQLSQDPIFSDLHFTLYGSMGPFEETVAPLRGFGNVTLINKFLTAQEIKAAHAEHGIFLCPTRLDTQGVSIGEAMASGLVPITNRVCAIPEFIDETCGILADGEDYMGLAAGIRRLYENPDLFLQMSQNASKRVREQCGIYVTIEKEIRLIKSKAI